MKKLKKYIESINLSYKNEVIIFVIVVFFSLLMAVAGVFLKKQTLAVLALLVPIVFIFIKFWQYTSIQDKIRHAHDDEFITIINYVEIFISNKFNVYNAFLNVKAYASMWMKDRIDELLNDIDTDKSVEPFVKFSKNFKRPIVENVMVAIFQMMEEGEHSNQLNQFDILFQRFSENHHQAKIEEKKRRVDSLAALPLIGAAFVTFTLLLGIMSIMGDIINVI